MQSNTANKNTECKGKGCSFGLKFDGDWDEDDAQSFLIATSADANNQYDVYCSKQPTNECGYDSPADLYRATHGTTVLTFWNSEGPDYCQRNFNVGSEGIICYSQSRGNIDPILAAHEIGHWFKGLVEKTGYPDPYDDLATEIKTNPLFPGYGQAIPNGFKKNSALNVNEDYANMHSMWVFNVWVDPSIDTQRRKFMEDNMYTWLLRLLSNP